MLAGANAGEQAERLPHVDVEAAEARADRRGDGGLQRASGAADALHRGLGQRRARARHHVHAGLLDVPLNLHARSIDATPRRRGQFGPNAVAGNQCHIVSHRLVPFFSGKWAVGSGQSAVGSRSWSGRCEAASGCSDALARYTSHYPLPTTLCPLPTAHCPLPTAHSPPPNYPTRCRGSMVCQRWPLASARHRGYNAGVLLLSGSKGCLV